MAWISVHEQVIGGKLRNLAKEIGCSQNEALGLLIRLWLWGINNANKEGFIVGADKADVADVLNIGIDKRYDPEIVVEAMINTGWIDIANGLYIHDWEEWQEQWYKVIGLRERDAARKREERKRSRLQNDAGRRTDSISQEPEPEPAAAPSSETEDSPIPENPEKPKKTAAEERTPAFEEFWKVYPRKEGKGEAYKKYKARLKDGYSEAELLEAATNYASRCARERTEKKYIKMAKTFLSDTLPFVDYIKKQSQSEAKQEQTDGANPFGKFLKG